MRKILPASNSWSRAFACVCAAVLVLAGLSPASAEEQSLKDDAKRAGHTAGSVTREIGQGAKTASKEIGQGAKTAGKEVGQGFKDIGKVISGAAKEGGREFRRAVKGE